MQTDRIIEGQHGGLFSRSAHHVESRITSRLDPVGAASAAGSVAVTPRRLATSSLVPAPALRDRTPRALPQSPSASRRILSASSLDGGAAVEASVPTPLAGSAPSPGGANSSSPACLSSIDGACSVRPPAYRAIFSFDNAPRLPCPRVVDDAVGPSAGAIVNGCWAWVRPRSCRCPAQPPHGVLALLER